MLLFARDGSGDSSWNRGLRLRRCAEVSDDGLPWGYGALMIVFLHGVPETAQLWDRLRAQLEQPSIALGLPGFGRARPEGFTATKDAYVEWLVAELTALGEPVDLVGHDWGAGLTYRVATAVPQLLRSWVADIANVIHPDYRWHDFAQIWQTPGEGEAFMAQRLEAQPDDAAALFEMFGVDHEAAVAMARENDATMSDCILDLYRSATPNIAALWPSVTGASPVPGLVLCPSDDPFGDEAMSQAVATSLGAQHRNLPGLSHWWPLQDPAGSARVIEEFVKSHS